MSFSWLNHTEKVFDPKTVFQEDLYMHLPSIKDVNKHFK